MSVTIDLPNGLQWNGVPQQSVLAPLLSLVYVNYTECDDTDDTSVVRSTGDEIDGKTIAALNKFKEWVLQIDLKLGIEKAKLTEFS